MLFQSYCQRLMLVSETHLSAFHCDDPLSSRMEACVERVIQLCINSIRYWVEDWIAITRRSPSSTTLAKG